MLIPSSLSPPHIFAFSSSSTTSCHVPLLFHFPLRCSCPPHVAIPSFHLYHFPLPFLPLRHCSHCSCHFQSPFYFPSIFLPPTPPKGVEEIKCRSSLDGSGWWSNLARRLLPPLGNCNSTMVTVMLSQLFICCQSNGWFLFFFIVSGSIEWRIEGDHKLTLVSVFFLTKDLKVGVFSEYFMVHLIEIPVNNAWIHKLLSAAFC